jgi:hypothetical protein
MLTSDYASAAVIGNGGDVYAYDDGTSTACVDSTALCVAGVTGAASSTVWGAGVNINLNQSMASGSPPNPFTVTGTGIYYSVSTIPSQGLRLNIGNLSGTSGTDYCTVLSTPSGTVPWSKFNTSCWDNSGTYLTDAPSGPLHVAFGVPATAAATPFSFCVDSVSFATGGGSGDAGMPTTALHVAGNVLQANGSTVRLFGVDRSGTEYSCIQGQGFFDGPVDQAAVSDMLAWHINTVRVPLNEDCWLGINGAPAQYSGSVYTSAITQWVTLLRQNGLYVILDLHWNAGGTSVSNGQQEMADSDHAPAFWTSVAQTFKSDQGIIFDLYNEPHDITWACWLNGGCQVNGWNAAGMNQLITAVRGTGAANVVMAGGLSYAGDLSEWLANKPSDPLNNLAASAHVYNFASCTTSSCWTSNYQPVAAAVPVITGELGENDCAAGFVDGYMAWADSVGVSYVGWAWNADFACTSGPSLISDWTGTATGMGAGFQSHFASVNP